MFLSFPNMSVCVAIKRIKIVTTIVDTVDDDIADNDR